MTSELKGGPMGVFSDREIGLIQDCRNYALGDPSGLPGHNILIIVSKLVDILDVLIPIVSDEYREYVTKTMISKYFNEDNADPSQTLFEQIKDMTQARNFIRRDMVSSRRTAEQIAKSQDRGMIYICPDDTYRNPNGDIIGNRGDSLYGTPYAKCIPFSFASEDDFISWLNEVIAVPKEKHNEDRQD